MILKFEAPDLPRDPEFGAALGAMLPVRDRRAFRDRVLAQGTRATRRPWLVQLDRWARPALAAAATITVAALLAGGALDTSASETPLTLDGAMITAAIGSAPGALMLAAPRPPDPQAVYATLVNP